MPLNKAGEAPLPAAPGPTGTLSDTQPTLAAIPPPARPLEGSGERGVRDPRYRVKSELARGAMGRVMVVQDLELDREVALKEPLDPADQRALKRFEREARLTARLDHPGIVSVHDFARSPSGEPYLIMRRVRGRPLSEALAEARTIPERLALLGPVIAVADAVAFAHGQGVIHRDLKPGNVLVGEHGETVVIDWGLAKDLRQGHAAAGPLEDSSDAAPRLSSQGTLVGALVGTPAYMSPEQARGEPADERCDVYALGAILYQLLSGTLPYRGEDAVQVLAQIVAGPPQALHEREQAVAPELSAIVARAMARDPAGRYRDAGELAAELKRFQTGRLVHSYQYSRLSLVRRWAKKNAPLLLASALFVVLGAAGAVLGVRRILAERDRANREALAAERVADFMEGMFQVSDPSESRGNSVTAREILDKAAARIRTSLEEDPAVQSRLMKTMGTVYVALGLYPQARPLFESAVDRQARLGLSSTRAGLSTKGALALLSMRQGRYDEAERLARETLEGFRRTLGEGDLATLKALNVLAGVQLVTGQYKLAEARYGELLAACRRAYGPDHLMTLTALANLAQVYTYDGSKRYAEAERLTREVLATQMRINGPDHPLTLGARLDLVRELASQDKGAEAQAILRDVVERSTRVLGAEHPETLKAMGELASALYAEHRIAEALDLRLKALVVQRRVLDPAHRDLQRVLYNIAEEMVLLKDPRAGAYLREVFTKKLLPEISADMEQDGPMRDFIKADPELTRLKLEAFKRAAPR